MSVSALANVSNGEIRLSLTGWDEEKKWKEQQFLNPGCLNSSSHDEKLFEYSTYMCHNLRMLLRVSCSEVCAFTPVLCWKSNVFCISSANFRANFSIFVAKHLHERKRSWC